MVLFVMYIICADSYGVQRDCNVQAYVVIIQLANNSKNMYICNIYIHTYTCVYTCIQVCYNFMDTN